MTQIGTPLSRSAIRALLLGSGELGKEVAIELQRLGIEVIAVDRYPAAPAMQVAHRSHVIDMLDGSILRDTISSEKPDFVIPEIEAIATHTLVELEQEGFHIVPGARAVQLTMNRKGIRNLAAVELCIPTSDYRFVSTESKFQQAIRDVGLPCVVKPVMSSSGKGQSIVRDHTQTTKAWHYAVEGARGHADEVMIEELIDFEYEITLLTVRHRGGVSFCKPIGHRQVDGDYRESWQPQPMESETQQQCEEMAAKITGALGGYGIFGVEFFIKGTEVWFSEVSPRPHDTGLVTLISQDLSEFALHVRAILGLPIPEIRQFGPSASVALVIHGSSSQVSFANIDQAISEPGTDIRLFGKPAVQGKRRMGVALAIGESVKSARKKANQTADKVTTYL